MPTRGEAGRRTRIALAKREAFRRSGFAMWATNVPTGTGELPEPFRSQYLEARRAGRITYTVLSYRTPIAWVLDTGEVVQPPVRYSKTTSVHQGMLYLLDHPECAW